MRAIHFLETLRRDVRYSLRALRKSPGFAAVAILTLALGIGANTAIFSMVNGILLNSLPYERPDELYAVYESLQEGSQIYSHEPINVGNFLVWQRDCRSFAALAALMPESDNLGLDDGAVQVHGARVSTNLLPMLGLQPLLGRNFLPDEDQNGRNRVVILTHDMWNAQFNADPKIVGKAILLNGYSFAVVGVLPAGSYFPKPDQLYATPIAGFASPLQYFVPLGLVPDEMKPGVSMHNFLAIARLEPHISREQALADLDAVEGQIARNDPQSGDAILRGELVPLKTAVVGKTEVSLWMLMAGAAVVLLIVCVNLASLLLARSMGRAHEVVVRVALGATRWRLMRQFLTEGVVLASAGGVLGLFLASDGLQALIRTAPVSIPRLESIHVDARVLLFSLGVSLVAGLLFSGLPGLRLSRVELSEALKSASPRSGGAQTTARLRDILAGSQVALCTLLLIAAVLLAESFSGVLKANRCLDVQHVLALDLVLPANEYGSTNQLSQAKREQFYDALIQRISALPDVRSAGFSTALPLQGLRWVAPIDFQEAPRLEQNGPNANYRIISQDYFQAIGLPLMKGRFFAESDRGKPVAILSEGVAKKVLAGRDPIGMHFRWHSLDTREQVLCEVTGVVADSRTFADQEAPLTVYLPYWVYSPIGVSLVVRAVTDPRTTAADIRETVRRLDQQVAIPREETMNHVVSEALAPRRFLTRLGVLFAVFATFLATLGLYGVISLSVTQRTQEIGLRMALGADPWHVLQLVLITGIRVTLAGLAIGILGALALTRLMSSLLYEISPTDPLTFMSVAILLVFVALAACYVPARRATRIDPMVALRHD